MKMFQIKEDDLADLERSLPMIVDRLTCQPDLLDNAMKVKIRRIQEIMRNVRWNYGPPQEIEIVDL